MEILQTRSCTLYPPPSGHGPLEHHFVCEFGVDVKHKETGRRFPPVSLSYFNCHSLSYLLLPLQWQLQQSTHLHIETAGQVSCSCHSTNGLWPCHLRTVGQKSNLAYFIHYDIYIMNLLKININKAGLIFTNNASYLYTWILIIYVHNNDDLLIKHIILALRLLLSMHLLLLLLFAREQENRLCNRFAGRC